MRMDLHVHSKKSSDGLSSVEELVAQAKRIGLGGIAICDHDYFHRKKVLVKDFVLLYGAEVSTDLGHVVVLGVDSVPTRKAEKMCEWVKAENGVVIPAHPFSLHKHGLGKRAFELGTCVEKYNGTDPVNNVISFFKTKKGTGGSDAHYTGEVGLAWTEFHGVRSGEDAMEALRKGKFEGKVSLNPFWLPAAFTKCKLMRLGKKFASR